MTSHRHKPDYINRLPTEVLDLIFQDVATISTEADEHKEVDEYTEVNESTEVDEYTNRALFPFNVAAVCCSWLAILKSKPQFWHHFIIDVVDDPTPFLDIFALFSQRPGMKNLDVIIFSSEKSHRFGSYSSGSHGDVLRKRENSRTKIVFEKLEPFLACFESITFDLVFQSSLPSATKFLSVQLPLLNHLALDCQIHDFNAEDSIITINKQPNPPNAMFLSLQFLSLTGHAFIELYQLGSLWWRQFKSSARISQLSITHFKFSKCTGGFYGNLTLIAFIKQLFTGTMFYDEIILSDLSLSYHPATTLQTKFDFVPRHCTFDNVSRDFLMAFFSCVRIPETQDDIDITFRQCSIPHNGPINENGLIGLKLENIPFQESTSYSADAALHPPVDDSLYNAISIFHNVSDLEVINCNGVTDEFFEWLSGEEGLINGDSLTRLFLHDCTGYTLQGLYSFVCKRANKESAAASPDFDELEISGISSLLEHDVAWLLEQNGTNSFFQWSVEGDVLSGWRR